MCTSLWQTPTWWTLSSTSVPCGTGVGVSIPSSGAPKATSDCDSITFSSSITVHRHACSDALQHIAVGAGDCREIRNGQILRAQLRLDPRFAEETFGIRRKLLETLPPHFASLAEH